MRTETIDDLTINVRITGKGTITMSGVSWDVENEWWILSESDVDAIVSEWASVAGREAEWALRCWALAFAEAPTPGVAPVVHVGVWMEREEDGQWDADGFPFGSHVEVLTPPPVKPAVVAEEPPSDAQFRHFGMAVAATLALWSEAEFDADEMIGDIDTIAKQRLGIPLDLTNPQATPERFAMWKRLAEAFGVEGPENDDD